jgi:hypothetical protein
METFREDQVRKGSKCGPFARCFLVAYRMSRFHFISIHYQHGSSSSRCRLLRHERPMGAPKEYSTARTFSQFAACEWAPPRCIPRSSRRMVGLLRPCTLFDNRNLGAADLPVSRWDITGRRKSVTDRIRLCSGPPLRSDVEEGLDCELVRMAVRSRHCPR